MTRNSEHPLDNDELADFESFAVIDNGSGFNDNNYESFETVDTQYKHALGGKGLGHFSWLKAFDHVKIDSHYRNGDGLKHRAFDFLPLEDEAEAFPEPSSEAEPRTPVQLIGFKSPGNLRPFSNAAWPRPTTTGPAFVTGCFPRPPAPPAMCRIPSAQAIPPP